MLSLDIGALDSLAGALGACSRACSGASGGSSSAASSLASGGLVGAGGSAAGSSASSLGSSASSASDALAAAGGGARLMARDARSLKASCEAVASSVGAPAGPSSCGTVAVDGAAWGLSASAGAVCSGPLVALAALVNGMSAEASGLPGGQAASGAAQALLRSCADASGRLVSLSSACSTVCSQASDFESTYSSGWGTAPIAAATASAGGVDPVYAVVSGFAPAVGQIAVSRRVAAAYSARAADTLAGAGVEAMGHVGLDASGTHYILSGFGVSEGAGRMPTRVSVANVGNSAKGAAALSADADLAAARDVAPKVGEAVGGAATVGFAAWNAYNAYQEEYDKDAAEPEARRSSDAMTEADLSILTDALGYALGGAVAGCWAGPIGILAGAAVGVGVSLVAKPLLDADFDSDGESNRDEIEDDAWESRRTQEWQDDWYVSQGMPLPTGGEY